MYEFSKTVANKNNLTRRVAAVGAAGVLSLSAACMEGDTQEEPSANPSFSHEVPGDYNDCKEMLSVGESNWVAKNYSLDSDSDYILAFNVGDSASWSGISGEPDWLMPRPTASKLTGRHGEEEADKAWNNLIFAAQCVMEDDYAGYSVLVRSGYEEGNAADKADTLWRSRNIADCISDGLGIPLAEDNGGVEVVPIEYDGDLGIVFIKWDDNFLSDPSRLS